jgi:hypothetical protein
LGPQGINLLSASVLPVLDPAIPFALAALGVLVGLSVGELRVADLRVRAAASLGASVTLTAVSLGVATLAWLEGPAIEGRLWTLALACGICAASSLTLPTGDVLEPRSTATRIAEAGVLLPIVAGGALLCWLRAGSPAASIVVMAQAGAISVAVAAAAWLLLTRASSETEERVFAVSALLLVGGIANALALSALLGGLMAGVAWQWAGHRPRDTIRRDVLFVQHTLLVLVLLVAGARANLTALSFALGAIYVMSRVAGTVMGGAAARRISERDASGELGRHLLRPGVFGVAFALNATVASGHDAALLLATVVLGTIGSDFAAWLLPPQRVSA